MTIFHRPEESPQRLRPWPPDGVWRGIAYTMLAYIVVAVIGAFLAVCWIG